MKTFHRIAISTYLLVMASPGDSQAFEEAEVRAIVRHVPRAELVGDATGVWMARSRTFRFDGGGNASEREHLIARVLDDAWAVETFSPFSIDYWAENQSVRVLHARVWHPDLTFEELPPKSVTDSVSPVALGRLGFELLRRVEIEFPDPKAGDVYEIILSKGRRPRTGEYNISWFMETFGAEAPVIEQRLEIQTPGALISAVETTGPELMRGRTAHQGFNGVTFLTGNLAPLPGPVEGGVFSRRATVAGVDSSSTVVFSTTTWSYLSSYLGRQWWYQLQELSPELSREVSRVTSGNTDPGWRARQLEEWVREEIETLPISHLLRLSRPLTPAQIFEARAGGPIDKAALLAAALRLAGIEATPVFVRTQAGDWAADVACPDQFDRILVRAELGDPIWLDPIDQRTIPPGRGFVVPILDPRTVASQEIDAQARFVGLIDFPGR